MRINPEAYWYRNSLHPVSLSLLPLSWLFSSIVHIRKQCYQWGVLKTYKQPVPVIVVGNITAGGTGKTPLVIWLTHFLQLHGYKPGIISRGVGGRKHYKPHAVNANDHAKQVGDEALLLRHKTQCPVVIAHNRADAATYLLTHNDCNVLISDDGLQHYRLARDIEIIMVDGHRLHGNKKMLPAGPLREPIHRIHTADFVIVKNAMPIKDAERDIEFSMTLEPIAVVSMYDEKRYSLAEFPNKTVHAIAAIGYPQGFFLQLQRAGFTVIPHAYPDHYLFSPQDYAFTDDYPIVMTEKDAVKCHHATSHHWYIETRVAINPPFAQQLLKKLDMITSSR